MKALASRLERRNFGEDDMMPEGFTEAVSKGLVAFRIVGEDELNDSSNECVIEDGVLYLQVI